MVGYQIILSSQGKDVFSKETRNGKPKGSEVMRWRSQQSGAKSKEM